MAAEKSARAAQANASVASDTLELSKQKALDEKAQARAVRLDTLVEEGARDWRSKGSLHEIVDREPGLTDEEIRQLVRRVFASGKSEKADKYAEDMLQRRRR
jgi:hypothetical protein